MKTKIAISAILLTMIAATIGVWGLGKSPTTRPASQPSHKLGDSIYVYYPPANIARTDPNGNLVGAGNIINVCNVGYGAKGDGVIVSTSGQQPTVTGTDDTAAIQAAINAAVANGIGGGWTVGLPTGPETAPRIYRITKPLTISGTLTNSAQSFNNGSFEFCGIGGGVAIIAQDGTTNPGSPVGCNGITVTATTAMWWKFHDFCLLNCTGSQGGDGLATGCGILVPNNSAAFNQWEFRRLNFENWKCGLQSSCEDTIYENHTYNNCQVGFSSAVGGALNNNKIRNFSIVMQSPWPLPSHPTIGVVIGGGAGWELNGFDIGDYGLDTAIQALNSSASGVILPFSAEFYTSTNGSCLIDLSAIVSGYSCNWTIINPNHITSMGPALSGQFLSVSSLTASTITVTGLGTPSGELYSAAGTYCYGGTVPSNSPNGVPGSNYWVCGTGGAGSYYIWQLSTNNYWYLTDCVNANGPLVRPFDVGGSHNTGGTGQAYIGSLPGSGTSCNQGTLAATYHGTNILLSIPSQSVGDSCQYQSGTMVSFAGLTTNSALNNATPTHYLQRCGQYSGNNVYLVTNDQYSTVVTSVSAETLNGSSKYAEAYQGPQDYIVKQGSGTSITLINAQMQSFGWPNGTAQLFLRSGTRPVVIMGGSVPLSVYNQATADPAVFGAVYTAGVPSSGVPKALMVSGG